MTAIDSASATCMCRVHEVVSSQNLHFSTLNLFLVFWNSDKSNHLTSPSCAPIHFFALVCRQKRTHGARGRKTAERQKKQSISEGRGDECPHGRQYHYISSTFDGICPLTSVCLLRVLFVWPARAQVYAVYGNNITVETASVWILPFMIVRRIKYIHDAFQTHLASLPRISALS